MVLLGQLLWISALVTLRARNSGDFEEFCGELSGIERVRVFNGFESSIPGGGSDG